MTLTDEEIDALSEAERRELIQRLMRPIDQLVSVQRLTRVRRLRLWMMTGGCVAMVPWLVYLGLTLPDHYEVTNWALTWLGFDCMLVALMAATAILGYQRRIAVVLTSFATGILLVCDAWFDITTSREIGRAIVLALVTEIPVAIILISGTFMVMRLLAARQWLTQSGRTTFLRLRLPR